MSALSVVGISTLPWASAGALALVAVTAAGCKARTGSLPEAGETLRAALAGAMAGVCAQIAAPFVSVLVGRWVEIARRFPLLMVALAVCVAFLCVVAVIVRRVRSVEAEQVLEVLGSRCEDPAAAALLEAVIERTGPLKAAEQLDVLLHARSEGVCWDRWKQFAGADSDELMEASMVVSTVFRLALIAEYAQPAEIDTWLRDCLMEDFDPDRAG